MKYDCAIIGAGPGGLIAAVYLSRFKRKVVVIDEGNPRAQWIPRIRNLVGYPDGITGKQLLKRLRSQATRYQADFKTGRASVRRDSHGFKITVAGECIKAKKVILATGMTDVEPDVYNLNELKENAVLAYCPICDGFEHSNEKMGLLVKDGKGLKKIPFLVQYSPNLHVFQIRKFRVSPTQLSKIKKLKVRFYPGELQSLRLKKNPKALVVKQKNRKPVTVKMAYVALGVRVNHFATRHINGLKKTKEGFIITSSHQETSVPGLFAVGDCVNGLSQVSVAVGHAAIAATRIHNELGFYSHSRKLPTNPSTASTFAPL